MNRNITAALLIMFCACSDAPTDSPVEPVQEDSLKTTQHLLDSILWAELEHDVACDVLYDTITNPAYNMHKVIMDRYTVPGKRGYWMKANGDTMDTYLYPQDIHVWMMGLDTSEQGIYRMLTNKIAFMILAHDAAHIGNEDMNDPHVKYFIRHLQNPKCNEVPFEELERKVKTEMPEPDVFEGSFKWKILMQIATQ